MKYIYLTIIYLLLTCNLFSQSFNGVPISGSLETVISRFESKNFKLQFVNSDGAYLSGRLISRKVDLFIVRTPISKQVFSLAVHFDKHYTWNALYTDFLMTAKTLQDKWGEPDKIVEEFEYPYEMGDGYELIAVQSKKAKIQVLWYDRDNTNIILEIYHDSNVTITYQNERNTELLRNEVQRLNRNIY